MLSDNWRQRKSRGGNSKSEDPKPSGPAVVERLHGWEEANQTEILLRRFDMDMRMGPCLGLTRLERWNRAKALGLNPPEEIIELIKSNEVKSQSIWDQDTCRMKNAPF